MAIYFIILLLLGFFSFKRNSEHANKFFVLLLLLMSAFRAENVGLDTTNYIHAGLQTESGLRSKEFIYAFLTNFLPRGGSYLLIVIFSIVLFASIYYACDRFKVNNRVMPLFYFVLFNYFNLSLNIARQYAAIGLVLLAFSFLAENNRRKYLFFVFVFLASGLHSAALVALLAYPFIYIDISKIKSVYLTVVVVILYVLSRYVLHDIFLAWTQYVMLGEDLDVYHTYFEQAESLSLSIGGNIVSLFMTLLSVYILLRISIDRSDVGGVIAVIFFISIFFDIFFTGLYGNLGRIRYVFNIINIIAYTRYYCMYKGDMKCIIVILLIIAFYGYEYYYSITGPGAAYGTVPYELSANFNIF